MSLTEDESRAPGEGAEPGSDYSLDVTCRVKEFRFSKEAGWTIEKLWELTQKLGFLRDLPIQDVPGELRVRPPRPVMCSRELVENLRAGISVVRAS